MAILRMGRFDQDPAEELRLCLEYNRPVAWQERIVEHGAMAVAAWVGEHALRRFWMAFCTPAEIHKVA
jgi:hypothetical protein